MRYIISADWNGLTVKEFLRKEVAASSRIITKMKQRGDGILVNGNRVTVRCIMKTGDILDLNCEDTPLSGYSPPREFESEERSFYENDGLLPLLDIIYEDDDILCVNKPPNMPTHPSRHHFNDTLANMTAAYYKKIGRYFLFRAANRLDADTSGLVLIAKDKLSSYRLNMAIKDGKIEKTYLAVVRGNINNINVAAVNDRLSEKDGGFEFRAETAVYIINAAIRRESDGSQKRIVAADGDLSETRFKILYSGDNYSTLEVYPITGRTHQIRVHLAELGYPITGDTLYGEKNHDIARQALHSSGLRFKHPHTGKLLDLKCPLPSDLKQFFN